MTKRPRLATNLGTPRLANPDTTLVSGEANAAERSPEVLSVPIQAIVARPEDIVRTPQPLTDIVAEAVVAIGMAASLAWTQGLTLQFRLASHMIEARPPGSDRR